jgi:hypothetical protein
MCREYPFQAQIIWSFKIQWCVLGKGWFLLFHTNVLGLHWGSYPFDPTTLNKTCIQTWESQVSPVYGLRIPPRPVRRVKDCSSGLVYYCERALPISLNTSPGCFHFHNLLSFYYWKEGRKEGSFGRSPWTTIESVISPFGRLFVWLGLSKTSIIMQQYRTMQNPYYFLESV